MNPHLGKYKKTKRLHRLFTSSATFRRLAGSSCEALFCAAGNENSIKEAAYMAAAQFLCALSAQKGGALKACDFAGAVMHLFNIHVVLCTPVLSLQSCMKCGSLCLPKSGMPFLCGGCSCGEGTKFPSATCALTSNDCCMPTKRTFLTPLFLPRQKTSPLFPL